MSAVAVSGCHGIYFAEQLPHKAQYYPQPFQPYTRPSPSKARMGLILGGWCMVGSTSCRQPNPAGCCQAACFLASLTSDPAQAGCLGLASQQQDLGPRRVQFGPYMVESLAAFHVVNGFDSRTSQARQREVRRGLGHGFGFKVQGARSWWN